MTLGTNLSLRLAAIMLAGFVALQFLVFSAMTLPGTNAETRSYNLPTPAELAVVADTLDAATPEHRALLVSTLDSSLYTLSIEPGLPPLVPTHDENADAIRHAYSAALPGRTVLFSARAALFRRISRTTAWPGRFLAPATLAISLRSGGALVLVSRPSALVRGFLRERAGLGAIGGAVLLFFLAWAVRQSTRPITKLATNIRAFSTRLDAPDLPVAGAPELRELARAYNDMKGRIAGLVEERTRILAGIAHDMRTYLTRLRLRADFIDDADQRARATRDLTEMSLLLDDTLLFAQPSTAPAALGVIDLAAETREMIALRREIGDAVELHGDDIAIPVRADRLALRRVLGNLIDNGLRHGALVTVNVACGDGGTGQIIVADNGPGVPADMLDRLGQAFDRLDPSRDRSSGGAGLGLAIVRALMDRQHGDVSFCNHPDGGLEATLTFQGVA